MNDLGRCIILSGRCLAAFEADDFQLSRRLMRERDALHRTLSASDVIAFGRWADGRLTIGDVDRIDTSEDA